MGAFTPTEVAAVAAVYALFVLTLVYRELHWRQLTDVFISAAKTTAVIMFLVAAAMVSAPLITVADIPRQSVPAQAADGTPHAAAHRHHGVAMAVGTAMDMTSPSSSSHPC